LEPIVPPSLEPTLEPPLGVRACQCDSNNVCFDVKAPFHKAEDVRICIQSTPPQSKIVQIGSLSYEMEGITQQIFNNDKPTSEDTSFNQTTGFRVIQSSLDDDFFREDAYIYNITARGSAIVEAESGDAAKSEIFFTVGLQIIDKTRNPTVSHCQNCLNSIHYIFGRALH
jgi:hypothetical protein